MNSMGKIRMKKSVTRNFLCLLAIFLITSCISVSAASVSLSKKKTKTKTLVVAQTVTLKIPGKTKGIKWTSSKKSVATVSKKGVVTARKAGKTVITGKAGKTSYKCKITVKKNRYIGKDYEKFVYFTIDNTEKFVAVKILDLQYLSSKKLEICAAIVPIGTSLKINQISLQMYDNSGAMFFDGTLELKTPQYFADEKGGALKFDAKNDIDCFKVIDLTKLKENSFNYKVQLWWL